MTGNSTIEAHNSCHRTSLFHLAYAKPRHRGKSRPFAPGEGDSDTPTGTIHDASRNQAPKRPTDRDLADGKGGKSSGCDIERLLDTTSRAQNSTHFWDFMWTDPFDTRDPLSARSERFRDFRKILRGFLGSRGARSQTRTLGFLEVFFETLPIALQYLTWDPEHNLGTML